MAKGSRKRNATQEDKESEVAAASSSRGQGHKSASAEQTASGEPPSKRAKVTGGAAAASSSTARGASSSSLFAKNSVAAPKKSAHPSVSSAKKSSQPAPRRSLKAESEKQGGGAATSSGRKSQAITTTKNLLPPRSNSKKQNRNTKQENDTEPSSSKVAKNKNSKRTTAKSKSNTKSKKSTRRSESKAVQKSEAKKNNAAKQTMGRRKGPAVWWQPKKQQDEATDEPKAEQHDFDGRAAAAASSSSSLGTGSGAVGIRKKPEGEHALFAPAGENSPEQRDSKKDQKKKSSRAGRKSKKHDTGGEQEDAAQHDGPWGRRRVPEDVRAAAAKKNSKAGRDTLPEAGPSDDLDLWGNPLNSGVELLAKPPAPASSSGAKGDRNAGGASGNTTTKSGKSKKVNDKDKVMKASGKLQESQNKNRSKGRKDAIAGQVATAGGNTGAEKGAASSKRDLLSAGTGAEGILDDSAEGDRPSGAKKRGGKNKAGKRGSSRATGKDSALMKNDDGGQDDGGQTTKDAKGRKVDYSDAAGKNNGGTKKRRAMPTVEPGAASGSLFGGNGNTDTTTLGGNYNTLTGGTTATTSAASVGLFGSSAASADTAATSGTSSAAQQNALLSGLSAYSQSLAMAQQLRQGLSTAMGPLGGGGAGGALNILSTSSSSSTSNRWTQRVADLKASGTKQMMALMELNEVLQYASEDMLVTFPMDAVLPLLIGILCQKGGSAAELQRTTSVADPFLLVAQFEDADGGFGPMGGGDNNDPAESQKMILACQILYSLLDIVPTCGRLIASYNGIPPLVEKLTQIDFIDVAEQIISLLDKLVDECPVQVLQNGGLLGMLQFLDFHHISLQRKAVGAANKMLASATSGQTAAKLRTLFEAQIRPALTPLSELLTHADAQVTAAACECWRKVLDATLACTSSTTTSFAASSATAASASQDEINLEELFPGSVVENFLRLQQRNKHFGNSGDILYILAMLVNQSSKLCERALELEIESEIRCALENEHTSLAALSLVCSLLPGVTFRASVSGGDVSGGGGEPSAGGQSPEKTAGSGAGLVSRGSSLLSKLFFGGSPKQGEQGPSPKQEGASATGFSGGRKEDDAALSTDAIVEKKQAASYNCSTPKLECTHLEFAIQNAAPEEQQRLQLFKQNKFRNLVKLGAASLKQVLRQKAGSSVSRAMGLNCVLPFVLMYRDGCEQGVSAEDVTELKGLLHACLDVSQLHTVTSESGYLSFLIIVEGLLRAEEADSGRDDQEGPGEKNLMHLYLHRQGVFKTIADNVEQCEKKLASQLAASSSSASSTSNVGGAPLSTAEQQATQEQGPGGFTPLMLIAVLSKKILQNFASTAEILHESTLAAAGGEDHSNDAPLDEDDEEAHQQLSPYRISANPCATVAELLSLAEDAGDHSGGSAYKVDCARTKQAFRLLHAALREDAIAPEEVARDLLPKLLPMFFFDGQEAGNSQLSEQGLRGAGADVAAHLRFFSSFLHAVFEGGDQHQTDEVHGDGVVADNCKIDYHAALLLCRKFAKLCLACLTPQLVETLPIFLFPQSGSKDRDPLMQALNGMGSRFMGGRYGPFGAAGSAAGQMNSALPHHLRSVGGGVVENALLSENVRQLGKPVKIRLAAKGPGGATKAAAPAFTGTSTSSALGGGRSGTSSKGESRIGSAGAAFEKKVRKAEKKRAAGAAKLGEAPAEDDYVLKTTAASAGDPPAGVPSSSSAAAASGGSAAAPSLPPTSSATTTQQQQMVDVLLVEPLATIAAIEDYVIERHGVPSSVKPLIYGPSGRRMESDTSLVRAVTEYLLLGERDLQAESSAGIGGPSSSTSSGALLGRTGSAASASAAAAAGFGSSSTNDEGGLPNKSPTILDAGLGAAFISEGTTGTEPFTLKPGQRFFASARDCVFAAQSARRNNASATSWGTTLYYEIPTAGTTTTTSVAKQGNKQESSSLSLMAEPSVVSKSEAKAVTKPNVALGQSTGSDLNPAAKKENDDKWNLPDPDKLRGTSSNKKNALAPEGKKSGNKAAASKAGAEQTDAKGWASFMSDFSDDDEDAEDHYIGGGKNLAEGIAAMGESPESAPATALDSPVESPALPGLGKTSSAGSLGLAPFGGAATGSGLDGSGSIFGAAAGPGAASGTLSSKGVGEGASFTLNQSAAPAASLGDALMKPTTSTLSSASSASSFQEYQAAAAPAADRKPKDPAAEVKTKAASGSAFPPDAQYKVKAYKYSATSSRTKHKLTTEIRREVPAFGAPMVFQDELEALAVRIHQTRAAFSVLCRDAYTKNDRFAVVLSPDSRSGGASGSGAAGSSGGAAASSAAARSCAVETASSAPGVPRSRGPDLAGEQRRRTSAASSVVTAVQAAHFAAGVGAGARSAAAADDRFSKLCVADEKLRSAIDFLAVLHHVAEYYERKCRASQASAGGGRRSAALREGRRAGGIRNPRGSQEARACDARGHGGRQQLRLMDIDDEDGSVDSHGLANDIDSLKFRMKMSSGSTKQVVDLSLMDHISRGEPENENEDSGEVMTGGEPALEADGGEAEGGADCLAVQPFRLCASSGRATTDGAFSGELSAGGASSLIADALNEHCLRQMHDPVSVAARSCAKWVLPLACRNPFLFSATSKKEMHQGLCLGLSRALHFAQNRSQHAGSTAAGNRSASSSQQVLAPMPRQKVRIQRNKMLESAQKLMSLYGMSPAILEVEFANEVGTGSGPTLEFYSTVVDLLKEPVVGGGSSSSSSLSSRLGRETTAAVEAGGLIAAEMKGSGLTLDAAGQTPPLPPELSTTTKKTPLTSLFRDASANYLFPAPTTSHASRYKHHATSYFRLLGQIVGKALLDSRFVDLPLHPLFWRAVKSTEELPACFTVADLKQVDSELYESLMKLRELSDDDLAALEINFTLPGIADEGYDLLRDDGGWRLGMSPEDFWAVGDYRRGMAEEAAVATFPLPAPREQTRQTLGHDVDGHRCAAGEQEGVEGDVAQMKPARRRSSPLRPGKETFVTNQAELAHYIHLVAYHTLYGSVKELVHEFRTAFLTLHSLESIKIYSEQELAVLIVGASTRDNRYWQVEQHLGKYVQPSHGFSPESATFRNLLEVMQELDWEQRKKFLSFVTGAHSLPPNGFAGLRPLLQVAKKDEKEADNFLPSVMTCANYLKLPDYSSKEVLREKLFHAIRGDSQSFLLS